MIRRENHPRSIFRSQSPPEGNRHGIRGAYVTHSRIELIIHLPDVIVGNVQLYHRKCVILHATNGGGLSGEDCRLAGIHDVDFGDILPLSIHLNGMVHQKENDADYDEDDHCGER